METISQKTDRRSFLVGASLAAIVPAIARAAGPSTRDQGLDALLQKQFDASLVRNPTSATSLGLDVGPRSALRGLFPDASASGRATAVDTLGRNLAALRRFGRQGLSETSLIAFDSAEFSLAAEAAIGGFGYHSSGFGHRPGPYGVTQLGGFYTAVASYLDQQHPIKNAADAEAYLARLAAVPRLFDADTALVRANAAMGVVAPRFALEQAVTQLSRLGASDPERTTMVASIARRTKALGLTGYGDKARRIFEGYIRAAIERQIAALSALLPQAGMAPGVGRLPDGEAYYAAALKLHTTTKKTASEIHELGLERVRELTGKIDAALTAQGYRNGTIRDRLDALAKAPGQQFSNDDAGREALIDYLNRLLGGIKTKLPAVFTRIPTLPYEIRRVPPDIELGAPGGSAQRGLPDGSRPGIFFINLRDTSEWPRYTLPTLAWHEGAPGHLFEGALSLQSEDLPIYRRVSGATAYSEGWGLYAEQVADELGVYENDPLSRIGYLTSYAFRAVRLVVDTGLHAMGWSREQAIEYMVQNTSEARGSAQTEIDRYVTTPGQACAYMIGQMAISGIRSEVEGRPSFDMKRFHDVVLGTGRVPLVVMERSVRTAFV